jgi:hypothetical protein
MRGVDRAFSLLVVIGLGACSHAQYPSSELTDDDVRAIARRPISNFEVNQVDSIIGRHHGRPVRMTVRCGDICPRYAVRIVRYDVDVKACDAAGGVVTRRRVPAAIAETSIAVCVPSVLGTTDSSSE